MIVATPTFQAATRTLHFGAQAVAKNRLYFSSLGMDLCDEHGFPQPAFFSVYQALMDGGAGFGFLGNASVDADARYNSRGLRLTSAAHVQALRPLFEAARARGFPLGVQLQHYGPQSLPSKQGIILTPSAIASPTILNAYPEARAVAMAEAQIQRCIEQFCVAARYAQQAGATLIQLQASNGYLISSFLSPKTNRRVDDWGGTPLKRARLLLSIVDGIRRATDYKVAVTVRLGMDDGLGAEGQHAALLGDVVAALEARGVAAITCSLGISETFRFFFKNTGQALAMSREGCRYLKRFVQIPLGFTGSVADVAQADEIIASGDADFVGFGRAMLADNDFVAKQLAGRADQLNRCRGDAFCFRDKKEPMAERVYCCVNPAYRRPEQLQQHYEENLK
ncbi:NADH:flavin oxidoreductase [Pseudomonas fluorescens]|uniref:oxidoreductase n=1 Tax=Pseudomonas fluorescens TaxID=294 RepID=UPI001CA7122A|nr:NADH:flavin oxidoreductase [Pseudomonas fluorescens]MBY8933480.1 NADH:flavin oxidoreductase [Pseudomonas fluorescens]